MTTTYTVTTPGGENVIGRGYSALDAAEAVLAYDGSRYELRAETDYRGWWQLHVADAAGRMVPAWDGPAPHGKLLRTEAASEAEAWERMAPRILTAEWRRSPEVMTDAEYDALIEAEG